ncbi:MAG: LpxL/LpxP family Kdo(2)-lipid IV(A) lauroyl/palmitoleoyl acyltransferase [Cellvibrio sp.]|nr:LpxL/LpxP family Kdo(2)-lipid IV(A) lauroyl/palmitoleoyl acyltransferase [Cellvibrio sp.]
MVSPHFSSALFKPRHWLSWMGLCVWYLLAQLPYPIQFSLAKILSPLLRLNKKRIRYARVNLRLCFPQMSDSEREKLLRDNLFSTAMAVFETGIAWFWPKWRLRRLFSIQGLEYVEQTQQEGCGALILGLHFTTLDIGMAMLGQHVSYAGMYNTHKNPVMDYWQKKRRETYCRDAMAFSRDNLRTMVSQLRKSRMVWYTPDRDLGRRSSVFVSFFGVPTATVTATSDFARIGKAKVIPFSLIRLPGLKGYRLSLHPPLNDFPSENVMVDARRVNEFMENEILKCPEQYFWAQPRFKTRPEGEAKVY